MRGPPAGGSEPITSKPGCHSPCWTVKSHTSPSQTARASAPRTESRRAKAGCLRLPLYFQGVRWVNWLLSRDATPRALFISVGSHALAPGQRPPCPPKRGVFYTVPPSDVAMLRVWPRASERLRGLLYQAFRGAQVSSAGRALPRCRGTHQGRQRRPKRRHVGPERERRQAGFLSPRDVDCSLLQTFPVRTG